jgi:hypothetical protein
MGTSNSDFITPNNFPLGTIFNCNRLTDLFRERTLIFATLASPAATRSAAPAISTSTPVSARFGLPSFRVLGEGASLELRGNFFNVFNKLNLQPFTFGTDNTRIESPLFGRSPGGLAGRVIEFQARLSF